MNSLYFRPLIDTSELSCFECGIEVMDNFIHNGLQESLVENDCSTYVVYDNFNRIVGFFSLMEDSLYLDDDDKDDLALYLKDEYRADTFYERKGFQRLYPPTSENTIRMYTTIF